MEPARTGRILIVDNDLDIRNSLEVLLDAKGYTVFATGTQLEAKHLASKERVHLAVLDVRMQNDNDEEDMSGLNLARQLDPLITKIMLTAYPSLTALKQSGFGDVPAVDFVFKDEGPAALLTALDKAFAENVGINFDLVIDWTHDELSQIVAGLETERRVSPPIIEAEVEELLCKLFVRAERIEVSSLIPIEQMPAMAQSGAAILSVRARYEGGWATPVVVKIATRRKADIEATNYRRYIEHFIDGFRHTQLQNQAQTYLLGGLVYTLVGTPLETCVDLATFYDQGTASEFIRALKDVFMRTCRHWYENQTDRQRCNLVELYSQSLKLSEEKMGAGLEKAGLGAWAGVANPTVEEVKRRLRNPIEWFRQHPTLEADILFCYTHGDLHSRNILVDQNNQAWLIDFYRSGPGHLFRDFIQLESDVKFTLLTVADLGVLYVFEAYLLNAKYFDDRPTLPSFREAELKKAFEVVQGIRYMAGQIVGSSTSMLDYYQGLYLHTLAILGLPHISPAKKRHAYLAASLLCERLERW